MSALQGQVSRSPIGGVTNAHLSVGLEMLGFDEWPPHENSMSAIARASIGTAWPVAAAHRAIGGHVARSYSNEWYHRIHVIPRVLNLGNLSSSQVQQAFVWNAWLVPQTLEEITGTEPGISVTGPDDFPMVFQALQISTWDIGVDRDGPSTIDLTLTWSFAGIDDGLLPVSGQRIVAWPLTPDWKTPVRERLAFFTDVLPSSADVEQRRAMRLAPRRVFQANLIAQGRERVFADLLLHSGGAKVWALPIWPDIQLLSTPVAAEAMSIDCLTTGRDFRPGGLLLLRGESAFTTEVAEIATVGPTSLTLARPTQRAWPARSRLYPVRTARLLAQPSLRRATDTASRIDVEFQTEEPCTWTPAVLPTYRGFPVFADRPEESEDLTFAFDRALQMLDPVAGPAFVLDTADVAITRQMHRWKVAGIDAHSALRAMLYALDGRRVAMWIPTHAWDLTIVATVGSVATAIQVENVQYARYGVGQRGRRDIRIELRSGTVFHRRITGAIEISDSVEQLAINAALGQVVQPQDVWRVSFMALARSDSDEFEIQHLNDVEGVATCAVVMRSVGDDL